MIVTPVIYRLGDLDNCRCGSVCKVVYLYKETRVAEVVMEVGIMERNGRSRGEYCFLEPGLGFR